jgi:hypothetical protein
MVLFLRSLGLDPRNFNELGDEIGGSPFIGDIVKYGMEQAQSYVVLFTPDEQATLHPNLCKNNDLDKEIERWQARPNVLLEAGMALAIDSDRTFLVVLGNAALPSDLDGRRFFHLNNTTDARKNLVNALRKNKCPIKESGDWHNTSLAGDFEACLQPPLRPKLNEMLEHIKNRATMGHVEKPKEVGEQPSDLEHIVKKEDGQSQKENFVEGVWFNVATLDKAVFYGVLHILFNNDGVVIHGMQYDEEGVITGAFNSYMSEYHGSTLRFSYRYKSTLATRHDEQGSEELTFITKAIYTGRFQDMSPHQAIAKVGVLLGWRVVDEIQLKLLETKDHRKVVKDLIAETKGLLPHTPRTN